jgi:hypothetical protein
MDASDYVAVTVTRFLRHEPTLVLFAARTEDGEEVTIALHPPYAQDLMEGLMRAEQPQIQVPEYIVVAYSGRYESDGC